MNLTELVPRWSDLSAALESQGDERLRRYVRQSSVSLVADLSRIPSDIGAMVRKVKDDLDAIASANVHIRSTKTYPVVTASVPASDSPSTKPTLCLYNMGDTRPLGDESEWTQAGPLSAETVEVDGQKRIVGRGVHNSKSGLAGMIDVIDLLVERGALPVNLQVIVDFEEEVRPDSVIEVVQKDSGPYQACTAALMPLMTEGFGSTFLSFKGIVVARVTLTVDRAQVHAGKESAAQAFVTSLVTAAHDFVSRIYVHSGSGSDLFSSKELGHVVPENERVMAARLAGSTTLADFADGLGLQSKDLRSASLVDVILSMGRSHVNLLGLQIGPLEGAVPTTATIDLEVRVGPSVTKTVAELNDSVERYLRGLCDGVVGEDVQAEVEILPGSGRPVRCAQADDPITSCLTDSYGLFGVDMPLAPYCFGCVPEGAAFNDLGLPFMVGGIGSGDNFHAPNEYIVEADYLRFKQWLVAFLFNFAKTYSS